MANTINNGYILLTSAGFLNPKVASSFVTLVKNHDKKKVVIVTTAAEGKENNIYSKLAKEQLDNMGFGSIDFLDLETQGANYVTNYDVIYVCGGNTFKLLKFAKETNLKDAILKVLEGGGLYIGVSAGSLLVGSSVQIANEISPDKNEVNFADFIGLSIVDLIIFPHYEPKYETEIRGFEARNNITVTRLTNNQAVLIQSKGMTIIE